METIILKCKYCGKDFEVPHWSKDRQYCGRECAGLASRGVNTHSKYQEKRIIEGKHQAYLNRVIDKINNGYYDSIRIDKIKLYAKNHYFKTTRQLAKSLDPENKFGRVFEKELKYILEYYNIQLFGKSLPVCFTTASLEGIEWYKKLLEKSKNWFEFSFSFKNEYDLIQPSISKSASSFQNTLKFIVATNTRTLAVNRVDNTKNLQGCGSSIEEKVASILDDMDLSYKRQMVIYTQKYYQCPNEKVLREKFVRPDFIVNGSLIIEVNGDYWHSYNIPEENLTKVQLQRKQIDYEKYEFYKSQDYKFIILWEHEVNQLDVNIIKEKINGGLSDSVNYKRIIYK